MTTSRIIIKRAAYICTLDVLLTQIDFITMDVVYEIKM